MSLQKERPYHLQVVLLPRLDILQAYMCFMLKRCIIFLSDIIQDWWQLVLMCDFPEWGIYISTYSKGGGGETCPYLNMALIMFAGFNGLLYRGIDMKLKVG